MSNAGQAILSIGGAALGFVFGGPAGAAWGFQLGGLAGSALFPTDLGTVHGPRLNDLNVQSSAVGAPIPLVYGTYAIAGNVIWSSGIIETVSKKKQGGKGGPTQTVTTYTYKVNCAVGVCEGEISGITRIWADAKLIYDARPQLDGETDEEFATRMAANAELLANTEIYLGDETQAADPTIESFEGVGNVSGFRGLAYVVFSEFQLVDYGNRVPNFRFEASTSGATALQVFTESGTWYKPAGAGTLTVTVIGAGGGGGSGGIGNAGNTWTAGGQGGGGGGISIGSFDLDDLGSTETVTVGIGGSGGAGVSSTTDSAGNNGSNGGSSSFGAHLTAGGGGYGAGGFTGAYGSHNANNGGSGTTDRGGCGRANNAGGPYEGSPPQPNGLLGLGPGGGGGGGSWQFSGFVQYDGLDGTDSPDASIAGGLGGHTDANDNTGVTTGSSPADASTYIAGAGGGGGGLGGYRGPQEPDAHGKSGAPGGRWGGGGGGGGGALSYGSPASSSGSGGSGGDGVVVASLEGSTSECVTLGDIVTDLCLRAGLSVSQIDVSDLTACIDGYAIGTVMNARSAINPLRSYGFFDCVESDGVLKWPTRGKAAVATIVADDLASHEASGARPSAVETVRAQTVDLPRRLRVHYAQTAMNYEPGEQAASRLSSGAEEVRDLELAVAMGDTKAAQIADAVLYDLWVSRNTHRIILDQSHLALEPGDAITAPIDGRQERVRIVNVDYAIPGLMRIECVGDDDGVYQSYAIGASAAYAGTGGGTIATRGTPEMVLLDLPLLRDSDNDPGYYAAIHSVGGTIWSGAGVYRSPDGGATYELVATTTEEATVGSLVSALPDGPTTIIDEGNDLVVELDSGELESISEVSLLAGLNAAAIGADNRWEVIQFRDATLAGGSPPTWTLTGLLRGRRGTEWAVGTSQDGDKFVLLDSALMRVPMNLSAIGASREHKGVLSGATLDSVTAVSFAGDGVALEPFSVVDVTGDRSSGDLVISWVRRGRIGTELAGSGVDIPLSEETEAYEIDVLDGGSPETVLRTLTSSTQSVTYTDAQQTADFGSPVPDTITVRIYQMSASVGRGYPAEATL